MEVTLATQVSPFRTVPSGLVCVYTGNMAEAVQT